MCVYVYYIYIYICIPFIFDYFLQYAKKLVT